MSMTLIEHIEVGSGGAANVTFTSIPQTYNDLLVVVSARTDTTTQDFQLYPNGSTSNLTSLFLRGRGPSFGVNSETLYRIIGTGSGDTANTFGNASIYIPNYASSNPKSFSADSVSENNANLGVQIITATLWNDNTAITSIELDPRSGNFVQYSSATLYGITAGSDGTTTVS